VGELTQSSEADVRSRLHIDAAALKASGAGVARVVAGAEGMRCRTQVRRSLESEFERKISEST
jgi:hypothetical protein